MAAWTRHRLWIVAALVAMVGGGADVTEAAPVAGRTTPEPGAAQREQAIVALVNKASRAVERDPDCRRANPFERPSTFTDALPSAEVLATFGILRRPQQDPERIPDDAARHLPAQNIYRSAYRIATSASGRRYLIVVAQNTNLFTPRPPECADALRAAFEALLDGRRPRFKREARTVLRQIIREEWEAGPDATQPHEGLFMFDYGDDGIGGGGGGADVAFVREHGMLASQGGGGTSIVSGLLPDGVATVELRYSRTVSRGRHRPPKRYRRAATVRAGVRDNVLSVRVPRPAGDAFHAGMKWIGPDGAVVRVVPGPS